MAHSFKLQLINSLPQVGIFKIALAAILLIFTAIVLSLLPQKSMMVDDAIHIPSGYSYIETHDFRLNQEHPPLLKTLSGFGLMHLRPELPLDSEGWQKAEEPGDPDDGTNTFCLDFFQRNRDKYEQILFWGRAPVVIVPLLLAIAVWAFTRKLFDEITAFVAAFLLLSEPNVIGNSTVVQDDLASALAVFLFVIALRSYFKNPAFTRALALGITVSAAILIKHSLIVLAPISLILLLAQGLWRKIKYKEQLCRYLNRGLIITCCFYVILIAGYAFDVGFIDDDEASFISDWFRFTGDFAESFQNLLVHLPILLPKYYLYGMDMVMNDVQNGRPAFLLGEVSDRGWWYYFPVAFVLKTSLPFLIATFAGLVWTTREIIKKKWTDGLYLILPPLLYLAMSMTSHLNIGVRHIMPVFPFFALMGAAAISRIWSLNIQLDNSRDSFANSSDSSAAPPLAKRRASDSASASYLSFRGYAAALSGSYRRFTRIITAAMLLWAAILVFTTYPNYLTHFSPLAGGPANGWKLLSDSNAETGQEVKNLADFLKRHGENRINGLFLGSGYIEFYGIEECDLPCKPDDDSDESQDTDQDQDQPDEQDQNHDDKPSAPDDGPPAYVAIGAWYLQEVDVTPEQKAAIDPYRSQQPEAVIGNSIFVFRAKAQSTDPAQTSF